MQTIRQAPAVEQTGQKIFQANITGASQQAVWLDNLNAFVPALAIFPTRRRHESALEAASRTDREIVTQHPGLTRYVRPRLVGEFEPMEYEAAGCVGVLVTVVSPGVRSRQPVKLNVYQRAEG
jgi:hypothetical protein